MKKSFLFTIMSTISTPAFALENLFCEPPGFHNPAFNVLFEFQSQTAIVHIDDHIADFGNLECFAPTEQSGFIVHCYSMAKELGMFADVGYTANLFHYAHGYETKLYSNHYKGSKLIGTFPCFAALNT